MTDAQGTNGHRRFVPNHARDTSLSQDELFRYSRHLILPEVGVRGQDKLKKGSVLIVGAGGLGSPAALYLAAAGVGRIGLVDFDTVDSTNLQRQVLYGEKDVGRKKLVAAKERLEDLNPNVTVETHDTALTSQNALDLVAQYDVVADGTDNFQTRYLVNDACVLAGKPNAYGSIYRFEGQASVFGAPNGPCYRCLYATPPPPGLVPSCAEGGVLGVLPGIIGSIQATETIKLLLGGGDTLAGRLLLFDAWSMDFTTVQVQRDPNCPVCGDAPTIKELIDYDEFCGVGSDKPAPIPDTHVIDVKTLSTKLQNGDGVVVVDVREPGETEIAAIDGAINIPLQEIRGRLAEIPRAKEIVLHCKGGFRSAQAWHRLREAGYEDVKNLLGGILAWQKEIEPKLPRY
ncbi:MAG: molybdopterin-synthase adenylyltransferase MoeB [Euryarchaeota archaeon]|nr:molybdopterin-synthase adenylyltransferase MoeB [Euryarchaeota archaeon]